MVRTFCGIMVFVLCLTMANAGDIKLPPPQTEGGTPVFEALNKRSSPKGNAFPTGTISDEELSTLLWAASGQNRDGKGWTVPMAMGVEPYCKIFVVGEKGAFLYSWRDHSLKEVAAENVKAKISPQPFAASASYILIFVDSPEPLEKINRGKERWEEYMDVAVGAMTQSVYLAAGSLGIGVRYAATMDQDFVKKTLKLAANEKPVCIVPIGKF